MGKNQSASNLPNIIQYNNGSINFVSGSTLLMQISSSGAITTTGVISGSNALSSSYAVSSSYSQNSELLDNLDSTSFVFTSSYNPASSSFSTRVTKIEGNYATTGSNVFLGAQTVCANITSTGTIIAQTLNVQQVTSSIVYSSGSNVFGCSLANTQQFTGSVLVTGSLIVTTAGTSPEFQVNSGGTVKGNALTDIHQVTGSFSITGSNAIFSVCCVGINTSSPAHPLQVNGAIALGNLAEEFTSNLSYAYPIIYAGNKSGLGNGDLVIQPRTTATRGIYFATRTGGAVSATNPGIRMAITYDGLVGIGTCSPSNLLHLYGTDGNSYLRWTSDVATTGTRIGYNGTEFRIDQQQNADITLRTNCVERMRITSAGDVLIARTGSLATGTSTSRLVVAGAVNVGSGVSNTSFCTKDDGGLGVYVGSGANAFQVWDDNQFSYPRFIVQRGGNVGIGASSPSSILELCAATPIMTLNQTTGNSNQGINFNNGATTYGKITNNAATGIMTIQNGNATGDGYSIRFITDGNERLRLGVTGIACFACQVCAPIGIFSTCVGINVTSPDAPLRIHGGAGSTSAPYSMVFQVDNTGGVGGRSFSFKCGGKGYSDGTQLVGITSAGHIIPGANGTQDLGSSSFRWCTVYTSDLSLNNGIGNYTIVEGENDLFLYNNNSCKVYKFIVQEVCPEIAPAKRSI
jgi:hypothetical protein